MEQDFPGELVGPGERKQSHYRALGRRRRIRMDRIALNLKGGLQKASVMPSKAHHPTYATFRCRTAQQKQTVVGVGWEWHGDGI